jgi:hypothetical protein
MRTGAQLQDLVTPARREGPPIASVCATVHDKIMTMVRSGAAFSAQSIDPQGQSFQ